MRYSDYEQHMIDAMSDAEYDRASGYPRSYAGMPSDAEMEAAWDAQHYQGDVLFDRATGLHYYRATPRYDDLEYIVRDGALCELPAHEDIPASAEHVSRLDVVGSIMKVILAHESELRASYDPTDLEMGF